MHKILKLLIVCPLVLEAGLVFTSAIPTVYVLTGIEHEPKPYGYVDCSVDEFGLLIIEDSDIQRQLGPDSGSKIGLGY